MTKNSLKFFSKIIAILLTVFLFFAVFFEINHAGHEEECHEDGCLVCMVLNIIHNINKNLLTVFAASEKVFYQSIILSFGFSALLFRPCTLVSRKIKLTI